ncbi:flavodoxin [Loigolactobacillus bifermentans]|jgi:flavodoxin short chain|uniref:Flavodoxin n=1 Tax=Loigolactobacillus bifermentans DSM 20003 TaxID=1423726 RepID=A0A0R1GK18_9LACO|nr:flavodoxin [Loigolactobacillus bifermentans]KRK34428.1 flavodoxin [Loigolactobacillus bifermentans DSM 20003]QGG60139.1 flavodoxin [Loigolactobacillus bifermentans]
MARAKIVYASMTGNNEEIADIISEAFENLNVDVEVEEISQADPADFEDVDICVVATYTYGEGDMPDEAIDFYEDLLEEQLDGKVYGVCGSGDSFYDHFAKSVDDFDAAFAKTGAQKSATTVKVDLEANGDDIEHLEAFAKALAEAAE